MDRITPPLPPAGARSTAALDWTGEQLKSSNGVRLKRGYPRAAMAFTLENSRPMVKRRQGCGPLPYMLDDE
ncbi:uncharacterized protein N7477_000760 [Penicillium maclennaniae]|uniref:uncharacterized protein n=1 Tax=Penicillium maclennaniae TaxID=1343394 RepID=UPI002541888A|nr:uncharacterized protein N7477_000760 [Penicillium maclennaniae]KAJ5684415.1 hypothetical protein N7477_000760 [Penicillium maclennaniae]